MHYKLLLGNRVYSGWSLRAWLLFRHFGIDFECDVVPIYTDEFDQFRKDCFPVRQLPALIVTEDDTSRVIWDSLSIAEYLNERHHGAGFWPVDPSMRAAARSLCAEMHSGFRALRSKMPVNLKRQYRSFKPDAETLADIERIRDLWLWTWSEFNSEGPYLFGENFTVADAFFTPVATRFRTYSIELDDRSGAYVDLLLHHPAVTEFCKLAQSEVWVMTHNEFDQD